MKIKKYIPIVLLGSVIVVLLYTNKCNSDKAIDATNLYSAVISELEVSENKLGQEVAKREIIQTSNVKDFLQLQVGQDSLLMELQGLVKEYKKVLDKGGSATVYEGETNIDESSVTNVTYNNNDSLPTYTSIFDNEWIDYNIIAEKDSINLNSAFIAPEFKQEYDYIYYTSSFYSFGKVFQLIFNLNIDDLEATSLYYLLERCMEKKPENRIFLYV